VSLAARPNVDIIVSGGHLRGGDLALSNGLAVKFFENLNADLAFLGAGGIDTSAGLTDYYFDEVVVRQTIIANSASSFVRADSSKIGRIARHRVARLGDLTGMVTASEPRAALWAAFARAGGLLIVA